MRAPQVAIAQALFRAMSMRYWQDTLDRELLQCVQTRRASFASELAARMRA
jgi:hypothetical protein